MHKGAQRKQELLYDGRRERTIFFIFHSDNIVTMSYTYYQNSFPGWGTNQVRQLTLNTTEADHLHSQFRFGKPPQLGFQPLPTC